MKRKCRRRNWRVLWDMSFIRRFWGLEHRVVVVGLVPFFFFFGKEKSSGHRDGQNLWHEFNVSYGDVVMHLQQGWGELLGGVQMGCECSCRWKSLLAQIKGCKALGMNRCSQWCESGDFIAKRTTYLSYRGSKLDLSQKLLPHRLAFRVLERVM